MIKSLLAAGESKDNIYVVCMDANSASYFKPICNIIDDFKLEDELTSYQDWTFDPKSNFAKIVGNKWGFIRDFYLKHNNFVFVDSDIYFRKNPEEILNSYNKDFCIQADAPGSKYCTGFMYFRKSITCDVITTFCSHNKTDDQLVLNMLLNNSPNLLSNVQLLPQDIFPNGHVYYKSKTSKDPYIVHNNHMVGIETKIKHFKDNGMWL